MIKFFRHIRQNAISKGKTGNYIKYALGEIILVVIGILIALQINNWNENSKNITWERSFLTDLKNELKSDYSQLEKIFNTQKIKGESCEKILYIIKDNNPINKAIADSIFSSIQAVNPTFFPTTGVYDSALASGKTELIRIDSLKYKIANLYNHFYKRLIYNGEILDNVVEKVDWEKGKFYDTEIKQIKSWDSLINSEFKNQINFLRDQNKVYVRLAKTTLHQINNVVSLLENELDNSF